MEDGILTRIGTFVARLAQADETALITALVLLVVTALVVPPPRKRRLRASVYLFLVHLVLAGLFQLFKGQTSSRLLDLASDFFLLSSIGRTLFILFTQGVFRRACDRLSRIFLDMLHGVIYLSAFLYVLGEAGVEPGSLVTGSAVLTGIIGLSMRDTLGNLFAGLALQAQRPFEVDDWIQWDDKPAHIGLVLEINWRATRVLTLDAVEITIPHGALGQGMIKNYTKPKRWSRRSIYFHAPLDVPTRTVQQVVLSAIAGSFGVQEEPPPSVVTLAFDERGVQYWLRFFTAEFGKRDGVDGEVRDRIWYALRRAGINVPAPRLAINVADVSPETRAREQQEQVAVRVNALRCVDFFALLSPECLERLAGLTRTVLYAPGEVILRQGEPGDELFLVRQGEVAVVLEKPGVEAVEVARMGANQFFGEMSLLTGEPRTATVKATRPCELLVVGKWAFGRILEETPALVEQVSEIVARRKATLQVKQSEQAAGERIPEEEPGARLLKRIKEFFSI